MGFHRALSIGLRNQLMGPFIGLPEETPRGDPEETPEETPRPPGFCAGEFLKLRVYAGIYLYFKLDYITPKFIAPMYAHIKKKI